jgi:hypothetical protein
VTLGEQSKQRFSRDLGHGIPHRHVDGADRDRALAVTARLFVRHQRRPDLVRIEIVSGVIEQGLRIGFHQPRRETLADQPALPVAAVGVEAVADHRFAVAHHIGDHGDEAGRHLGKIDIGVADRRGDRFCDFADIDDADGHGGFQFFRHGRACPGHPRLFVIKEERRGCPASQTSLRQSAQARLRAGHDEPL